MAIQHFSDNRLYRTHSGKLRKTDAAFPSLLWGVLGAVLWGARLLLIVGVCDTEPAHQIPFTCLLAGAELRNPLQVL